jgi:hypothetical protein
MLNQSRDAGHLLLLAATTCYARHPRFTTPFPPMSCVCFIPQLTARLALLLQALASLAIIATIDVLRQPMPPPRGLGQSSHTLLRPSTGSSTAHRKKLEATCAEPFVLKHLLVDRSVRPSSVATVRCRLHIHELHRDAAVLADLTTASLHRFSNLPL